jgi:hypothetical protein
MRLLGLREFALDPATGDCYVAFPADGIPDSITISAVRIVSLDDSVSKHCAIFTNSPLPGLSVNRRLAHKTPKSSKLQSDSPHDLWKWQSFNCLARGWIAYSVELGHT